jgi:hypothetical protein
MMMRSDGCWEWVIDATASNPWVRMSGSNESST